MVLCKTQGCLDSKTLITFFYSINRNPITKFTVFACIVRLLAIHFTKFPLKKMLWDRELINLRKIIRHFDFKIKIV